MKRCLLLFISTLISSVAIGQNIQLHYAPRHLLWDEHFKRDNVRFTFEMQKGDKHGSTYMFIHLDAQQSKANVGSAFLKIMRDHNLGKFPIKLHLEYNGGVHTKGSIPNAYIAGLSYPVNVGNAFLTTYIAYKYHAFKKSSHDLFWVLVWNWSLGEGKFTLSGVVEVWTENKRQTKEMSGSGKLVALLSEARFWYNINEHLSVGTIVETSNNFHYSNKTGKKNKAFVTPTLGVKWTF